MTGTSNAPIVTSVVQDILDNAVQRRHPPAGLNYAAYAVQTYPDGANSGAKLEILCKSCDIKHLERLINHFSGPAATPAEQISLWEELLPKLHEALLRMDGDLVKAGQGANVRAVFDVDMGGFFYDRINSNTVLFGATLHQLQVNNGRCEKEMRQMVSEIQAVFTAHGA
jgi:hypothetical protein